MKTTRARRVRRAVWSVGSAAGLAASVLVAGASGAVASSASGAANPIVRIDNGLVRGAGAAGVSTFLGLPYAAPPTGNLRWRPPRPGSGLVRGPGRDTVRAELPAGGESVRATRPVQRGLPVPERLHAGVG